MGPVQDEGEEQLSAARSQYDQAKSAVLMHGATPEAEEQLRASIVALRSAMNRLEGKDAFEEAHQLLDEAGAFARNNATNGCHLHYDGSTYFQRCPVALAHNRVAFSPTMLVREADCSICRADLNACSHVPGLTYDGIECHQIIRNFDVLDVFLVGLPAQPDARIQAISIETPRLAESLGEEFYPGIPVLCDRCLSPCDGIVRNFDAD